MVSPPSSPAATRSTRRTRSAFVHWKHPVPSARDGHRRHDGRRTSSELDVLYNIGGNLFETMPNPKYIEDAFQKIKVRIHQDISLNTSTPQAWELVLLLPAQTRYEQRSGGTSTSTERRIRFTPEISNHPQVGEARPEWEIPCQIAIATHPGSRRARLRRYPSDSR